MTKEEFLIRARNYISDDPMDRVPNSVKQIMDDPDVLFDAHMHIFDKNCVTERYILLRFLEKVKNNGLLVNAIEGLYDPDRDNEFDELFRIMEFNTIKKVIDRYKSEFAYQSKMVLVPLTMDLQNWISKPKKSVFQQINEIKPLMNDYPILPFLAIDPINAEKKGENNLYSLFEKAFTGDNKFFGVKVYPSLGYLPSHPALMPIYEICQEKKIPVTTHCGGTLIRTNNTDIKLIGFQIIDDVVYSYLNENPPSDPKGFAQYINDPAHWEPVLHKYPNLKLNLGHFGGINAWETDVALDKQRRLETIQRFMEKYENVYADFSYNLVETQLYDNFFNTLKTNGLFKSRAMFGTDYWMVLPKGDAKQNQVEFIDRAAMNNMKDILMRDNPKNFLFL